MGFIRQKVVEVQLQRLRDTLTNFENIKDCGQIWWHGKLAHLYAAEQGAYILRLVCWTYDNRVFISTEQIDPRYMEITALFEK